MTPGQLADLLATLLATVLFGVIGFLGKWRFDKQDHELDGVSDRMRAVESDVARLTEAQKAVVSNQIASSRTVERVLDESDELEDKISQLDGMTSRLYDRLAVHDKLLELIRNDVDNQPRHE